MCNLNPDYGNKTCPATYKKKHGSGPGPVAPGSARLAKKLRSLATWVYCLAFKLVKVADKLDPPPEIKLESFGIKEILMKNFDRIIPWNSKLH